MPRTNPKTRLVRDAPTWLVYGQLATWAYFVYGFSPVVPLLRVEQGTSQTVASLHGTAFALGAMAGAALIPQLMRLVDRNARIWIGMGGAGVAILVFNLVHPLPATLTAVGVAAMFGAIAVNSITVVLSDMHGPAGSAAISEGNAVASGIGAVAPLLVGGAVSIGWGWRPGVAVTLLALAALALTARGLGIRVPGERTTAAAAVSGPMPWGYWLAFVSLMATSSVEVCLSQWSSDLLHSRIGLARGTATACVSVVILGMCLGRLVGGRLTLRYPAGRVLLGGLVLTGLAFVGFWWATAAWLAVAALGTMGLGMGVHFPLGISLAIDHSGGKPDLATARSAYAFGFAFGVAPFALSALSDQISVHAAFLLVPVFLVVSAVAVFLLPEIGDFKTERLQQAA
jgi:MFS family permease